MKLLLAALLVSLASVQAFGQQILRPSKPGPASDERTEETVIHATWLLTNSEEGQAALEDFHRRKANGELPYLRKSVASAAVGDTVSFRVFNFDTSSYTTRRFVWKAEGTIANVWVEVGEATGPGGNGHVTDADINGLLDALENTTPSDSFNPAAGILENNIDIFGDGNAATSLPNVDGDGKTDVFLHDVMDGGVPGGGFIAGYVDPSDLSVSGNGNNRDILHMDSNEGLLLRTFPNFLATAAHELQHLIHFNYSSSEETFVNEGLSEYAEIANGYPGRTMRYLDDPVEQKLSLFSWDGRNLDYERAGFITSYFAERTDALTTGSVTRDPANGRRGYENAAAAKGITFQDILVDFHTATLLNGTGLTSDTRFNFQTPTFADENVTIEPSVIIDGRTIGNTSRRDTVNGGTALYRIWDNVEDFTLTAAPIVEGGQTRDLTLGRAALRAIVERPDGTVEVTDLDLEPVDLVFPGLVDRLTLIFVHTKPVSSGAIGVSSDRLIYDYSAEWLGAEFSTEFTQYDDGQPDIFLGIPSPQHFSTRFELSDPDRTTLDVASIAIYFSNQFSGGPSDESTRDFTLEVRADSNGVPGRLLFSKVMNDPRVSEDVFQGQPLRFLDIDLSNEDIPELTPAIHIGAANAGTDGNTIVTGIAQYDVANVSHLSGDGGDSWAAMWGVSLSDGTSLNEKMSAVRLQVLISAEPVAIEDEAELPKEIQLAQNFPNPFNPTTTVRYALPATADVTLTVYDILGRQMGVFAEGPTPAGQHEVLLDASRWASGMYVYVLQAGETRLTRQMVLLK
ncbi:MAG: T9SS type A sorting domain-containing protein [Rhodothermia bacterium]|nr:T9SS type A sorting domain-containing protein [Rhodothermia bacterium]